MLMVVMAVCCYVDGDGDYVVYVDCGVGVGVYWYVDYCVDVYVYVDAGVVVCVDVVVDVVGYVVVDCGDTLTCVIIPWVMSVASKFGVSLYMGYLH